MKLFGRLFILGFVVLGLSACSTQERTSEPQMTDEELGQLLSEFQSVTATSNTSNLSNILGDGNKVTVYHARDGQDRPAESVLSLVDMGFMDAGLPAGLGVFDFGLLQVDVMFVDATQLTTGERIFALLIKAVDLSGNTLFYSGDNAGLDYEFSEDEFLTTVKGARGEGVILSSNDVSPDYAEELADSIKLTVELEDGAGIFDIGQISTLHGYELR